MTSASSTEVARIQGKQTRESLESIFISHLPCIERIAGFVTRKHGLQGPDAEDFLSIVKTKLLENDYSILAKFRGESSLPTFLAVVIAGIFRDYRVQRWGRWRPSVTARSMGADAMRLEALINRDMYPVIESVRLVSHTSGLTEKDVHHLLAKLPLREPLRPIEVDVDSPASRIEPTQGEFDPMMVEDRQRVENALNAVVEDLPSDDRILLKMKFWENMTVADISRITGMQQKQLYRKLESIGSAIRVKLTGAGVSDEDVRELLAS